MHETFELWWETNEKVYNLLLCDKYDVDVLEGPTMDDIKMIAEEAWLAHEKTMSKIVLDSFLIKSNK